MNEEAGFIEEIQEHPEDEVTRLVYADWLEDHGKLSEAEYLRTEAQLAKLPLESPEAPQLRNQLWQAWATVDRRWLMTFTQPRMVRANPTPFPSAWRNFDLGTLREGQGTYDAWAYDSVPALPIDEFRGEFQYLDVEPANRAKARTTARARRMGERMVADAAEKGVALPAEFVKFMDNPALNRTFHSVTGCEFTFPDKYSPIRSGPLGEGMHVLFYRDSQSCLLWDLYVHASGGHCVIARWPDYFEPDPPDTDSEEPPYTGPRAWFVAPSFEAFVYRVWVENQLWYIQNADFLRDSGETPPRITPGIQAYIDYYTKRKL